MAAPAFLTIPLELREAIYIIYLSSPNLAPSTSTTTNRANRIRKPSCRCHQTSDQVWNWEEQEPFEYCINFLDPSLNTAKPSSLPLLLCNRQINSEVSSTIALLIAHSKATPQYELECDIVDGVEIYPSWRQIPFHFKGAPISCVQATFSYSGYWGYRTGTVFGNPGWAHGCMIWSLMALLNRFLKWGPNFFRLPIIPAPSPVAIQSVRADSSTNKNGRVSKIRSLLNRFIKRRRNHPRLTSDFTTPPGAEVQGEHRSRPIRQYSNIRVEKLVLNFQTPPLRPEELASDEGMIHPRAVVEVVADRLSYLFSGDTDTFRYGRFIASRIGCVHLQYDGEEHTTWDLASNEKLHRLHTP